MDAMWEGKDEAVSLHVAPMVDVSTQYFRYFMRLLSRRVVLWTEMIKDEAIVHSTGDARKMQWLAGRHDSEQPVVFQLGGSDPQTLAQAAEIVATYGYDEINLNVGCPSNRVACRGEFGASLMLRPELVRDCIHAMQRRVQIPVTVKTRLGVDNHDTPEFTRRFIDTVAQGGCRRFYMHARKAWLSGLSPAENRTVPPLDYTRVHDLCRHRPDLLFCLNGGISTLDDACRELRAGPANLTGAMMGRAAINNPALFARADELFFGEPGHAPGSRAEARRGVLRDYASFLEAVRPVQEGGMVSSGQSMACLKPVAGLFHGFPGARLVSRLIEDRARVPEWRARGVTSILEGILAEVEARHPQVMAQPFADALPQGNNRLGCAGGGGDAAAAAAPAVDGRGVAAPAVLDAAVAPVPAAREVAGAGREEEGAEEEEGEAVGVK